MAYYIPGANPVDLGYQMTGSGAIPNPIRGSVLFAKWVLLCH